MHPSAKRPEQRQALASIELGAFVCEPLERFVCQDPLYLAIAPNTRLHERSIHPGFATPLRAAQTRFRRSARRASRFGSKDAPARRPASDRAHFRAHPHLAGHPLTKTRQEEYSSSLARV